MTHLANCGGGIALNLHDLESVEENMADTVIKDFVPVIATVVGGVLGAGLSVGTSYISRQMQRTEENRKVVREKLQEALFLCHAFQDWLNHTMKQAREPQSTVQMDCPAQKIRVLVRAYEVNLLKIVDEFSQCYEDFEKQCTEYRMEQLGPNPKRTATQVVIDLQPKFEAAEKSCKKLTDAIENQIRQYVTPRRPIWKFLCGQHTE